MTDWKPRARKAAARLASNYGMAGVLLLLCAYYSLVTFQRQQPTGPTAAARLMGEIPNGASVLIVATSGAEDASFAAALERALRDAGARVAAKVVGGPVDARTAIERLAGAGDSVEFIATTPQCAAWPLFDGVSAKFPGIGNPKVIAARSVKWPTFLKVENLVNIANQVVVIALLAAGMTLVIITGGIDLSVGSLVALSAVVTATLIRSAGGTQAATGAMTAASLGAIAACAVLGLISGLLITVFKLPPFIATLGMMQVTSGLAYLLAQGQSIYDIPESFVWLGRGAELMSIPNAVMLMAIVYLVAHVVMSRTVFGRYVYATGGNPEAARLSGVNVGLVLLAVYAISGAMAGLGGVVVASQLKAGSPTYGAMYELYAIAAVVVGGTSLTGGAGRILGTLIGALIIAVIQNGMNLTGVESYLQKVVLGLVILAAVILDMLRRRGWMSRMWMRNPRRGSEMTSDDGDAGVGVGVTAGVPARDDSRTRAHA
ncbi:MAG: ABC transporter permease [Tepidisphaeraceae bacterium]